MGSIYSSKSFGAEGIAVHVETVHCPARTHAGWRPGSDQAAKVWGLRDGADPSADARAIQAAIDTAHGDGGGTVRIEPGNYLIQPLRLRSNVRLHLEEGAALYATACPGDYRQDRQLREEEMDRAYREAGGSGGSGHVTGNAFDLAVISAEGCENVALSGTGTISGQGGAWFIPWWKSEKSYTLVRPMRFIEFRNCSGVRVEDVRIEDSCGWTLVFNQCRTIRAERVQIRCLHGPNVDGIDIVDSGPAEIRDCDIFTTDDGICLKSTVPEGVVEDVIVRDCRIRTFCNAFKIGTETLGTVRRVSVKGLRIYNLPTDVADADTGINLNSCDGGLVEMIEIEDVSMSNTRIPVYLYVGRRSFYQQKYRQPVPGVLKDVSLSGLNAMHAADPSVFSGYSESPITGVRLANSRFENAGGCPEGGVEPPPETPEGYPSAARIPGTLPAAGLWVRNVRSCRLEGVAFAFEQPDQRPLVRLDDSEAVIRSNIRTVPVASTACDFPDSGSGNALD